MFQFRRLLTRYRQFLIPGFVLLSAICIALFVLIPAVQKTIEQFQDVAGLKEQVEILQQKVNVLNNLDEVSLEQNVSLTTSAIPLEKSLPTILSTIEGISQSTNVTLLSLVIDTPGSLATQSAVLQQTTEEKRIGAFNLPFSVTLRGTFEQIKSFLATSNKVRRLVRAKSFSLNFGEEQLLTQISFETFYAPLSTRNDTEKLQILKNEDFDTLATLEQYPHAGVINNSTPNDSSQPQDIRQNPFSL